MLQIRFQLFAPKRRRDDDRPREYVAVYSEGAGCRSFEDAATPRLLCRQRQVVVMNAVVVVVSEMIIFSRMNPPEFVRGG